MKIKSGDIVCLKDGKETAKVLWLSPSWKEPPRVILDQNLKGLCVYSMDKLEKVKQTEKK